MKIFSISFIIILIDQITKLFVKGCSIPFLGIDWKGFPLYTSFPLLGDFARFTYIENAGMAFGIDVGAKLFFSLFSLLASIAIFLYLYSIRKEKLSVKIPIALILGGAVGNLIDRIFYGIWFNHGKLFYGKVVDFIDVDFIDVNFFGYQLTRWPVFNVADASVTIGITLLLVFQFFAQNENSVPLTTSNNFPLQSENISQEAFLSSDKTT